MTLLTDMILASRREDSTPRYKKGNTKKELQGLGLSTPQGGAARAARGVLAAQAGWLVPPTRWPLRSRLSQAYRLRVLLATPNSRSLALARLSSSVPGCRRTTSRNSRMALGFWPSSSKAIPFCRRAVASLKLLG